MQMVGVAATSVSFCRFVPAAVTTARQPPSTTMRQWARIERPVQPLYRRAAREVHEAMGSPANYHVVIVTGRIAHVAGGPKGYFEGADDVVCPSWP